MREVELKLEVDESFKNETSSVREDKKTKEDWLIDKITHSVAPTTWAEVGGAGRRRGGRLGWHRGQGEEGSGGSSKFQQPVGANFGNARDLDFSGESDCYI